jgi:protein N-terminal glutamine amidohydrolase
MERATFSYTANYCEENIWHLCQHPDLSGYMKHVLIISNEVKKCPLYAQQSAQGDFPVWWDYHVVLLASKDGEHLVFDFDTTLAFPVSLGDYLQHTFPNSANWLAEDLPLFKSIPAADYVRSFSSDRSHMVDVAGQWIFTPPVWAPIASDGKLMLRDLRDFTEKCKEQRFTLGEMQMIG